MKSKPNTRVTGKISFYTVCDMQWKKSYDLYQKHFSHLSLSCVYLPSTSNANRSIKEDVSFEKWREVLKKQNL